MRVSRLLAVPALLAMAAVSFAQSLAPSQSRSARVLEMVPGQAQTVIYYPDFRRLEAKWSKVVAPFGGKDRLLDLERQTGIDPARVDSGPVLRVSFQAHGAAETWVWLVPAKDPNAALKGLSPTRKDEVWTWEGPRNAPKKQVKAAAPATWFGMAKAGYLVVAGSRADLAAFKQPASRLSVELAPYTAWMDGHDVSVVATTSAVVRAAGVASHSLKPTVEERKAGSRLKGKLNRWVEMAKVSVHHVLAGLDVSEEGGLAFEARALLTKGSPFSQELEHLPPVAGHPMTGLATLEFAAAFGGEWSALFDVQSTLIESLNKAGKVQTMTLNNLQKAMETQSSLVRSVAGLFAAPSPGAFLMSGMTSLVRVSDSQAYLASMEETSKAQTAFLQDLGNPGTVTFTRDILPGVPSCGVTTRLGQKDDPATASSRAAMERIFGGDAIQMSLGALDDHRVLAVMGGPDLLKARMEAVRKAPEGLAPSIMAVEPDLGRDHRFVFYLDPRGMRAVAEVVAGMFGRPHAKSLPAIPEVPAVGLALSLDPGAVELRGSVRAETLKATATLVKALGALIPSDRKNPAPGQEPDSKD